MEGSTDINRATWDERAPAHAESPDYDLAEFVADPSFLSRVVQFDLPRLGDIRGLRGVHLQCHIGTDTISLARLGARMTGVDFSPAALAEARKLAERTNAHVDFVESEIKDAVQKLGRQSFELVYTGIGALCWLPSVKAWGEIVSELLVPGGRLFLREGHPMLWSLEDERADDLLVVRYPYFETDEPLVFEDPGTYVETTASFQHNLTHSWNHGLGEIVTALLDARMEVTMLEEHDSVPWNALPGQMEQVGELREWRLIDRPLRVPHTYTLQAVKRS